MKYKVIFLANGERRSKTFSTKKKSERKDLLKLVKAVSVESSIFNTNIDERVCDDLIFIEKKSKEKVSASKLLNILNEN